MFFIEVVDAAFLIPGGIDASNEAERLWAFRRCSHLFSPCMARCSATTTGGAFVSARLSENFTGASGRHS
jgi:hypothetical protein